LRREIARERFSASAHGHPRPLICNGLEREMSHSVLMALWGSRRMMKLCEAGLAPGDCARAFFSERARASPTTDAKWTGAKGDDNQDYVRKASSVGFAARMPVARDSAP